MKNIIRAFAIPAAVVVLTATPALAQKGGSGGGGGSKRAFYITGTEYYGGQAPAACAAGYHMASMWEMLDVSNMKYESTLGYSPSDAGSGPPSAVSGWVRTGREATAVSTTAGAANCNGYTSSSAAMSGTSVHLTTLWQGTVTPISPWMATALACSIPRRVWCVQD